MESNRPFDGMSRESILNLAREYANEQIGAQVEWDASQVSEFCQRITDLFMIRLRETGQGLAAEALGKEIVHEFQLRCDQEQKIRIERIAEQAGVTQGLIQAQGTQVSEQDFNQWTYFLFRHLVTDMTGTHRFNEQDIDLVLKTARRLLLELAPSSGHYTTPMCAQDADGQVKRLKRLYRDLARSRFCPMSDGDEGTYTTPDRNVDLIRHFIDLSSSKPGLCTKAGLVAFSRTIDQRFESETELDARFVRFKKSIRFLEQHEKNFRRRATKEKFFDLTLRSETLIWQSIPYAPVTAEELCSKKQQLIEEFDRICQEKFPGHPYVVGKIRVLLEQMRERWIQEIEFRFNQAEKYHAKLQTYPTLANLCAELDLDYLAHKLSPLLEEHGEHIEEIVRSLAACPKLASYVLRNIVDERLSVQHRLYLTDRSAEFIQRLIQSGEQYTENDLLFLGGLCGFAEEVCVDPYSEAASFSKEMIARILSCQNSISELSICESDETTSMNYKIITQVFFLYMKHTKMVPRPEEISKIASIPFALLTPNGLALIQKIGLDRMSKTSSWINTVLALPDDQWQELSALIFAHPIALDIIHTHTTLHGEEYPLLEKMPELLLKIRRLVEWIDSADHLPALIDELATLDVYLSKEVAVELARKMPPRLWTVRMWYHFEVSCAQDVWNTLGKALSQTPLSCVPTEILLRFLAERPTAEVIGWLQEETDVPSQKRSQTLSEQQAFAILNRFRRFEGDAPLLQWAKALCFDAQRAQSVCAYHELPFDESAADLHKRADQLADMNDPLSVIETYMGENDSIGTLILKLLVNAKEISVCGGRRRLVWGDSARPSSLCVAEDGAPLRLRDGEGKLHTYYQMGMLNSPTNSVPSCTLHRNLLRLRSDDYAGYHTLFLMLDGKVKEDAPAHVVELYCEIGRIKKQLVATYPRLRDDTCDDMTSSSGESSSDSSFSSSSNSDEEAEAQLVPALSPPQAHAAPFEEPPASGERGSDSSSSDEEDDAERRPSSVTPTTSMHPHLSPTEPIQITSERPLNVRIAESYDYTHAKSLFSLLKVAYRDLSREATWYRDTETSHRYAIFFQSLLCLVRSARMQEKGPDKTKISLNHVISFRIETVSAARWTEPESQDQQEMESDQLREFAGSFLPYPVTSITNPSLSACFVKELICEVQSLSESSFAELLHSCQDITEGPYEEYPDYSYYPALLHQNRPDIVSSSLVTFFENMTHEFGSILAADLKFELKANTSYPVTGSCGAFGSEKSVPRWLRSQGSFASAICATFTPIEPEDHSGNCGVNSFLLGLKGIDTYEGCGGEPQLQSEIRVFRKAIQQYAIDHREELLQASYLEEKIDEIITHFTTEIDGYGSPRVWANDIVWWCAAQLYGRPISIYTAFGMREFRTDEQGVVAPCADFKPEGEQRGSTIHLMFWDGAHYCLLKQR